MTEKKFGDLTIIKHIGYDNYRHKIWLCRCECGKDCEVTTRRLNSGAKTNCGCKNSNKQKGSKNRNWKGCGQISRSRWNIWAKEAKQRNFDFLIDIQWAWDLFQKQDRKCAISGIELSFSESKDKRISQTASLDRIDSSKGYTKDNVQWVHKHINIMKHNHPENYFFDLIKSIYKFKNL